MEAINVTRREIEIRFDDEDDKIIRSGWRLEQRYCDEQKTLKVMIVPGYAEQPNPHSDLPHGRPYYTHYRPGEKGPAKCGAYAGGAVLTPSEGSVCGLGCPKIMAEEKPASDVADFFTHYMPDRESQAILCPANELEGRRWRTYDARSVTCPNCLAAMTVQGLTADQNTGPDVSAEVQKCTAEQSGVGESEKWTPGRKWL